MIGAIALLFSIHTAFAAVSVPTESKVSASVKDTSVSGLEGFNINIVAPFKVEDYIVGFKYALGDIKKFPESLFAKKDFNTFDKGTATIEADFSPSDNNLGLFAKWKSDDYDATLTAEGDLKDKFTACGFEKSFTVNDNKFTLKGTYDVLKKTFTGSGKVKIEDTDVKITYGTEDKDPVLSVTHALDAENEIAPSIGLKTGDMSYGYTRKWTGGSLKSRFFPGDKVAFEWKDEGSGGVWTTKADVPTDGGSPTVSFSRDWNY